MTVMKIQLLVSAVDQDAGALIEQMHISTDAVIVNQCDRYGYEEKIHCGHRVQVFSMPERGVGLSRNTALLHADTDVCVFTDEDIVLSEDYKEKIRKAYHDIPDADMILVNVKVVPSRRTYWCQRSLLTAFRRRSKIQQRRGQSFYKGLSESRVKTLFPHGLHREGNREEVYLV